MQILGLTTLAVPKAALVAVALAAGITVATVDARPASALPRYQEECTGCHGGGSTAGSVSAVPSVTSVAPGATYTVAITAPSGSGRSGYWIAGSDAAGSTGASTGVYAGPSSSRSFTATMTAPSSPGSYRYKVWAATGHGGVTSSALYSLNVAGASPAPTPARARLTRVSPGRGRPGALVAISGSRLGRAGVVRFAGVRARVTSWRSSRVVVRVPSAVRPGRRVVVVTPTGTPRSNAITFTVLRRAR